LLHEKVACWTAQEKLVLQQILYVSRGTPLGEELLLELSDMWLEDFGAGEKSGHRGEKQTPARIS